jgi:hypothetical protein
MQLFRAGRHLSTAHEEHGTRVHAEHPQLRRRAKNIHDENTHLCYISKRPIVHKTLSNIGQWLVWVTCVREATLTSHESRAARFEF